MFSCPRGRQWETSGSMLRRNSASRWNTSATARRRRMFWYRSILIALVTIAASLGGQKQHADVNHPDADGTTPLEWAVYNDDLPAAQRLLHAGADAKMANRYGVTPLSLAATNRNAVMAAALLNAGADASAKLPDG